jgi:hypothetical protein
MHHIVLADYAIIAYNHNEVMRMPKALNKNDTVRYTTVLPVKHVNELKEMVRETQIPSVNEGIRLAVEGFIKAQNKLAYEQKMQEAAEDRDYMKRLAETEADFALVDDEDISSW